MDGLAFAPLDGVRVLDLTTSVAGPYCTLILAALGADVVKVERPDGGDDTRGWGPPFWEGESAAFLSMNAGKRSLALNVRAPEGLAVARALAARSDVVVQNLRPGLAERLGLGFDDVAAVSPRVVYCSIGAFGKDGPLSAEPGYDPLMQAAGGIMSVTGENGRPPVRAGVSIIDQGTAMWAALAIVAALAARERREGPQLIDTSLYETAVNWMPIHLVNHLASGGVPRPMGSGMAVIAPYEAFEAGDGRWLMVAAGNDRLFAALCGALDRPELADDPRFRTNAERVGNRDALAAWIAATVRAQPAAHWLERLRAAGVPTAPVQRVDEVATHPQTQALGLLQPVLHAQSEDLRLVGLPLSFDGRRLQYGSAPPRLGEHTDAVLREAGVAPSRIDALRAAGVVA